MATKFLKSPNGGIYKDSTGKPIAVEPERVIRDIDGSIPASTLEDISVSTETASTNGVSYVRATMKGEVTYTDNTHDTINYCIDLPIKAGDGVTIEAQPIEGATGNKQLVISASGGGGTTLNKYSVSSYNAGSFNQCARVLLNAKGKVMLSLRKFLKSTTSWSVSSSSDSGVAVVINYMGFPSSGGYVIGSVKVPASGAASDIVNIRVSAEGTLDNSNVTSPLSSGFYLEYWNDTEIT